MKPNKKPYREIVARAIHKADGGEVWPLDNIGFASRLDKSYAITETKRWLKLADASIHALKKYNRAKFKNSLKRSAKRKTEKDITIEKPVSAN